MQSIESYSIYSSPHNLSNTNLTMTRKIQYLKDNNGQRCGVMLAESRNGTLVMGMSVMHPNDRAAIMEANRANSKLIKQYKKDNKTASNGTGLVIEPLFDKVRAQELAAASATSQVNFDNAPRKFRKNFRTFVRNAVASFYLPNHT